MTEGTIFSIEEFSVFDGPGIRTTVFLKGCPLSCTWCHNPEGQSSEITVVRSPNGCIGCNSCIETAVKRNGVITFTETGIKNCPMSLLRKCGEKITAELLCKKILKNERLLKNGGVTFSGGEPLLQTAFLAECLDRLKGRLHTAVQTSGFCDENSFMEIAKRADHFLYDLKIADCEQHKKYTGVSNRKILNNLKALTELGKSFVIRIPLIPTVTDTVENLTALAEILVENKIFYAELLPYNKMAGGKYKMLMREYTPNFNTELPPQAREDIFEKFKINVKIL